jgi:tetrahydromethanopterin S-methyltransferase subunit G
MSQSYQVLGSFIGILVSGVVIGILLAIINIRVKLTSRKKLDKYKIKRGV